MAQQKHLELEDLGEDVKKVLIDCGKQLKSAPFKDNGENFEVIDDRKTLEEASRDFVKIQSSKVSAWARSMIAVSDLKKRKCRLIAWRFPKPMTLPIPLNVTLDLIPCEISGTPTIGGRPVEVGQSRYLNKAVEVQPSFTCLVRVYGPAS